MTRALITGVTGQDGAYLAKLLLEKGYRVFGTHRPRGSVGLERLLGLDIAHRIELIPLDLTDLTSIYGTVDAVGPDEVYNLAAQSLVGSSFEDPLQTLEVNAAGCLRLLEAVRTHQPTARFFQASSSDMFGKAQNLSQDEAAPFRPRSPYGVAKLCAHWMTVNYREVYGLFACSGILFNHESPLRSLQFVTRKVTHAIARIKLGLDERLRVGNLDTRRDWGYAPEYVECMWLMLQQGEPDDYVVATGEVHTVRDFVVAAFRAAGVEIAWEGTRLEEKGLDVRTGKTVVEVSEALFRPAEAELSVGSAAKAKAKLGWAPRTRFDQLVSIMMEADLGRVGLEAKG